MYVALVRNGVLRANCYKWICQPLTSQVTGGKVTPYRTLTSVQVAAATYESGSQVQRNAGHELVGKLNIKKGSSILDLGCGTGYLANVLSDKVGTEGKITAVDPDGERLKIAREKYSASNIEYIQANDKTFPSLMYNLVICNVAIHWISDKEALFKRVHENLYPGGMFAFNTSDGPPAIPRIGQKLFNELLGPEFLHRMQTQVKQYLTLSQYEALATKAGFDYVTVNTGNVFIVWKNLDHYIETMHGWFGGEFNPTQFDPDALQKLKEEYGDGPVEFSEPTKKLEIFLSKK